MLTRRKINRPALTIKLVALICVMGISLLIWNLYQERYSPPTYIKNISLQDFNIPEGQTFDYLLNHLDEIIYDHDIDGAMMLSMQAFREGSIDAFGCHSLTHEIGHHAGIEHFDHVKTHATTEIINFCAAGFMHGVEEGLASIGDQESKGRLHDFCMIILPKAVTYPGCYHGAGHAFMRKEPNAQIALTLCDTLIFTGKMNPTHCYRGVFSENANRFYEGGKNGKALLSFCASLPQNLQTHCAGEVNGLGLNPSSTKEEVEQAFRDCYENDYGLLIQIHCMRSVSWITIDNNLAKGMDVIAIATINDLPKELKETYITASINELKRHVRDAHPIDISFFCYSFPMPEDQKLCTEYMER